ncbi:MAG: class I SAM-dependent methyltransferase [Candidatus Zambryskibacteria bacterium]|nr:class I SAM-dependent methyltransferase [Candidatus Zambryskibacteria bacterium]
MEDNNLDQVYIQRRKDKGHSFYFRLKRRTSEILRLMNKYYNNPQKILDIGAADGSMLDDIKEKYPVIECIGLEQSREFIKANKNKNIRIIQGDAHSLPFQSDTFDVIIAAAIIEHVTRPEKMLEEAHRVLKRGGIFIVTSPNPFFDKVGRVIGWVMRDRFLKGEKHNIMFNLEKLKKSFKEANFEIIQADKFMFSPMGVPGELRIERIIKSLGLSFLLLNQIIVGKK